MHHVMAQLLQFHQAMDQTVGDTAAPDCTKDLGLRLRLIAEEFEELLHAIEPTIKCGIVSDVEHWIDVYATLANMNDVRPPDVVAAADALADISYVTVGAAVAWGIPLGRVFDEVHRSNLAKSEGEVREDGKRLKPAGWTPPDIAGVLERSKLGVYALVEMRKRLVEDAYEAGRRREGARLALLEEALEEVGATLEQLGYTFDKNGALAKL